MTPPNAPKLYRALKILDATGTAGLTSAEFAARMWPKRAKHNARSGGIFLGHLPRWVVHVGHGEFGRWVISATGRHWVTVEYPRLVSQLQEGAGRS